MTPSYRLCLLLAIGAILTISVSGGTTSGTRSEASGLNARSDAFEVWDAFRPLSRDKRESILGPVGLFFGSITLFKAEVLKAIFDMFDTPLRWADNILASWANYFNNHTNGNPVDYSGNDKFRGWSMFG